MKKVLRSRRDGFTLVELLVTTLIIAMLMAIGLGVSSFATKKADRSKALAQMEMIANALEEYRAEYGGYPDYTTVYLPYKKVGDGSYSYATPNLIDMIDKYLDPTLISEIGGQRILLDPWGNEWKYYHDGNGPPYALHNNSRFGYDLWSVGADGMAYPYEDSDGKTMAGVEQLTGLEQVNPDSNDDITNWEEN